VPLRPEAENQCSTSTEVANPEQSGVTGFTPSSAPKISQANPQDILDRVAAGELLRDIAKDYGCSQPAVSWFISKRVPKETWAQVREQSIAARLEQSTHDMDVAQDALMLARARESARLWMWRAERELPHLYGQRQQITHDIGPDLGNMLRDARKRVADTTHAAVLSPVTIDNDTQTPD
jgi:hypothetical protein